MYGRKVYSTSLIRDSVCLNSEQMVPRFKPRELLKHAVC